MRRTQGPRPQPDGASPHDQPCHDIAIPERCEPKMSLRLSRAGVCVCARTRAVRIARSEPGRADPAPRTRTDANTIVADRASGHRPRRGTAQAQARGAYLASSYLLWKDVRARAALLLSGGPTAPHTARSTRETTTDGTHCGVAHSTAQHSTAPLEQAMRAYTRTRVASRRGDGGDDGTRRHSRRAAVRCSANTAQRSAAVA